MPDIYKDIGSRLRKERTRLGWTQDEMGERSGLHPAYIGQIERGSKKISIETLRKLAQALSLRMGDLLNESSEPLPGDWDSKIGGLLRENSSDDRELIYNTLRQLAKGIRRRR